MKKKKIVLCIIIIFMLLTTKAYAYNYGSINLTPSKTDSLSTGEEFTVTLSLSGNFASSLTSMYVNCYISINEEILEELTVDSIITNSDKKVEIDSNNVLNVYDDVDASSIDSGIIFSSDFEKKYTEIEDTNYQIYIKFAEPIESSEDLFTITFKVKSEVATGTYENAISYIVESQYTTPPVSTLAAWNEWETKTLDLTITSSSSSNDDNNNINSDNDTNTNTSGSDNSSTDTTNNQVDNTVASGSLPFVGYKIFILPIIVIIIVGFIFYKKYTEYSKF